jgi:leader peptidase (prepilin peptidase) / N-methyltransferase
VNGLILATLLATVLLAAVHDARTGLIPDRLSLGGFFLICALSSLEGVLPAAILGAGSAAAPMLALHLITRGRGLGFGDVKLALPIGAALFEPAGLSALGCAFVIGAVAGIALLFLSRAKPRSEIAFAPYLAAGTIIATIGHIERII